MSNSIKKPHKWLFIPIIIIGIATFIFLIKNKQPPQKQTISELITYVRTIPALKTTITPTVIGYGTVQPSRTWEGIAEVSGKIIMMHPELKDGNVLKAGELLLKIDPVDYQLAIAQAEANVQSIDAQLEELLVREKNSKNSLAIERRVLAVAQKELNRLKTLKKKGSISQSNVDQQQRSVLTQSQSVQQRKNELTLLPAETKVLQAKKAVAKAELATARRKLAQTEIYLPFTARIAAVNIEKDQFAKQGNALITVDSIDKAEVTAQIAMGQMRNLLQGVNNLQLSLNLEKMRHSLSLQAKVILNVGDKRITWKGKFLRTSNTIDTQTRTIGVVVGIDNPYKQAQVGVRPPLTKNTFVSVELTGKPSEQYIVIPRVAIHDHYVYSVDAEQRLQIRPVEIAFTQDDFAIIKSGLEEGEQVLVSRISPAISGMKLATETDTVLVEKIKSLSHIEQEGQEK